MKNFVESCYWYKKLHREALSDKNVILTIKKPT